jgi:uncharacterized protein YjiS (DUF1127 family)
MSMSTQTNSLRFAAAERTTAPTRTFWQRLYAALTASGEARARRELQRVIQGMGPQQLADLGFTPEDVAKINRTGQIPASYWR